MAWSASGLSAHREHQRLRPSVQHSAAAAAPAPRTTGVPTSAGDLAVPPTTGVATSVCRTPARKLRVGSAGNACHLPLHPLHPLRPLPLRRLPRAPSQHRWLATNALGCTPPPTVRASPHRTRASRRAATPAPPPAQCGSIAATLPSAATLPRGEVAGSAKSKPQRAKPCKTGGLGEPAGSRPRPRRRRRRKPCRSISATTGWRSMG